MTMKLILLFIFFAISININSVNGGLIKDILGSVHDNVHTFKENVRKTAHVSKNNDSKYQDTEEDVIHFEADNDNNDNTEDTAVFQNGEVKEDRRESVTTSKTKTVKADFTSENPEDKDGRENFSGGCLAGYRRTPDGRCKPTF